MEQQDDFDWMKDFESGVTTKEAPDNARMTPAVSGEDEGGEGGDDDESVEAEVLVTVVEPSTDALPLAASSPDASAAEALVAPCVTLADVPEEVNAEPELRAKTAIPDAEDATAVLDKDELPTVHVSKIPPVTETARWLVRDLWTGHGVGIIGGHPKVGKSWLGLDLAVSVASGTPCFGHYVVEDPGPVLVFLAEDAPGAVRVRIEGLCKHRGLVLDELPVTVVDTPSVRLDTPTDQRQLQNTVARLQPRLLVLDPLVRLHDGNENSSQTISALLGFLRQLQRTYGVAIVLAHHLSKRASSHPGQALRGSGDLHAWGDSNLYLDRQDGFIAVTPEHRSEPAGDPFFLRLVATNDGDEAHLEVVDAATVETAAAAAAPSRAASVADRIIAALTAADGPMKQADLRERLHVKNEKLVHALADLRAEGRIEKGRGGWTLVAGEADEADEAEGDGGTDGTTD